MARSTFRAVLGLSWVADPDPLVTEYQIFAADTDDESAWLGEIDAGSVNPDFTVPASETEWRFPGGQDFDGYDFAVVSHAVNPDTGVERWSTPYSPALWQNVPLVQAPAELAGVSGGALLFAD